jgi:phenylalanyl-tRNA synthetase beta chain
MGGVEVEDIQAVPVASHHGDKVTPEQKDFIFTIKLTPNLGHALSIFGLARELSALTGVPLHRPVIQKPPITLDEVKKVNIQTSDLCGRFSGRIIRDINPKVTTPLWMQECLIQCGQRPVNLLVDISNYVMFAYGQPSHIFDLDKLEGNLAIRWSQPGETLKLLNGDTIQLEEGIGVITDSNNLQSLAGVLGSETSAVSHHTKNIYLEAAFWYPQAIAGVSRKYRIHSDAAYRFERGVDPRQTLSAIDLITNLILQTCGGRATDIDDQITQLPGLGKLQLRATRVSKVIGIPFTLTECQHTLEKLSLSTTKINDDVLSVTVPSYRFDLAAEIDLIEEIARLTGYQNLHKPPPRVPLVAHIPTQGQKNAYALRRQLAQYGYLETINYSFVPKSWETQLHNNPNPITLLNPMNEHMDVMRSSLLGSLLHILKYNLDRKSHRVRIFEIGRVFRLDEDIQNSYTSVQGIKQPKHLAGLSYGNIESLDWQQDKRENHFFDIKADIEGLLWPHQAEYIGTDHPSLHPGRSTTIVLDGQAIGWVGELHPKHCQDWGFPRAPLVFELDFNKILEQKRPKTEPISKFPIVERDLALWVPITVTWSKVRQAVLQVNTKGLLQKVRIFDVYQPDQQKNSTLSPTHKSFTLRLTLSSLETTLTDQHIEEIIQQMITELSTQLGAKLRE